MEPRLVKSYMTGRIYIVTKYRPLPGGGMHAQEKYDVTEQFNELVAEMERQKQETTP